MKQYEHENNTFFSINGKESINEFVKNYISPVFLYSKKVITHQYNILRKALPDKFKIFYAQKSNPHSEILKLLNSMGAGCDTASLGELKSALEAGFPPKRIMMTGPGKTEKELLFTIENNLLSINAESLQEIFLIDKLSAEHGKKQKILIRINPEFEAGETNRIIGGMGVSKFGIDIESISYVINQAKKLKHIKINGIHIFNSSQILDYKRIFYNIKNVIDTAKKLSTEHRLQFKLIDAGGGFGIPYLRDEEMLDTERLGNELINLINDKEYKSFLSETELISEPGRFLTGLAGVYLFRVLYTKESQGKKIAITDGGINHFIRPVLIGQKHLIINMTALIEGREDTDEFMVAGPLCTALDVFDESALLAKVNQGDILAILNAGAYGYTESMPFFLSHPAANEIFIN
jgi:diaminopimelate decarboxylase